MWGTSDHPFDLVSWTKRWLGYLENRYQLKQLWMIFVDERHHAFGWPLDTTLPDNFGEQDEYISLELLNNEMVLGKLVILKNNHQQLPQAIMEDLYFLIPVLAHELSYELDRHRVQQKERLINRLMQSTLDVFGILLFVLEEVVSLFQIDAAIISDNSSFGRSNHGILASFGFKSGEAEQFIQFTHNEIKKRGERIPVWPVGNSGDKFQTSLIVPLTGQNPLDVTMTFLWRDQLSQDFRERCASNEIFREIALALERSVLYSEVRLAAQRSVHQYHTMVEGLTKVLGLRDHETEEHTKRVSLITMQFVKHLQIPSEQWSGIQSGALLHDIGKLGVPDAILLKPGSLSTAERQMMQMHVVYGHNILEPFTADQKILDIVMYHHERWDGGGYPHGLKGEKIPWVARMFSVVDVFDALTSDRPYRTAWLHSQALEFIKEQAGWQFDPDLVRCFLEITDKLV